MKYSQRNCELLDLNCPEPPTLLLFFKTMAKSKSDPAIASAPKPKKGKKVKAAKPESFAEEKKNVIQQSKKKQQKMLNGMYS